MEKFKTMQQTLTNKGFCTNHRIRIMGTYIDPLSLQQTVDLVEKYIIEKKPLHLMGVNSDKIIEMHKNNSFARIVNNCELINADGISIVLAGRILGERIPERVAGIDLMNQLVDLCDQKGYSIYLLGAKDYIVKKTADVLCKSHNELNIVGFHDGFFLKNEWKHISNEIKTLSPDIVFVGISSPTKEYLIDFLQKCGNDCVFMGVGGSFDVISGAIRRAPKWVQNIGMEWFYRFLQEPKRLFKRYFIGNLAFVILVIAEKWRRVF